MKNSSTIIIICSTVLVSFGFKKLIGKDEKYSETKNGITVTEAEHSADYPGAKLSLHKPTGDRLDTGNASFDFQVKDFQLGIQTPDADSKLCANSAKGQHIHFIMDNEPYVAQYTNKFDHRVKEGDHVLLAFLSRSYHESMKKKDAYVLTQFSTKEKKENIDLSKPLMFYSRPKGQYVGEKETKKLLLDFYLVNVDLDAKGYKVKATIDGNEFLLDRWKPYFVEGLGYGKHVFRLQLVDKSGKIVPGKFNDSGNREIQLTQADPIKEMK